MRKEISRYWGDETYPHREAIIYYNNDMELFEVEFWDKKNLVETRQMLTEGVAHSEPYAESAAENWCLGYIQ
jgi:hypothetical protein